MFNICPNCSEYRADKVVAHELLGKPPQAVVLDSDLLWRDEFNQQTGQFFDVWLRVCQSIAQSGRPSPRFHIAISAATTKARRPVGCIAGKLVVAAWQANLILPMTGG